MKNLLIKELKLASSPLSYIFLIAALMTLLPGYPILMGAFFICFGIFHSFQNARESNDVLYSLLLPVKKSDFVKTKFAFTCAVQLTGFALCAVLTALRMTVLSGAQAYKDNALMNPSPVFLAFVLLLFSAFNLLFVGGFFKTAYKIGIPFLLFGIAALLIVTVAESLHFFSTLAFLNTTSGEKTGLQTVFLALCAAAYCGITYLSYRTSKKRFELLDL